MSKELMDKYPDTRDLTQEVVDLGLNLIHLKIELMAATVALSNGDDAPEIADKATKNALKLPVQLCKLITSDLIKKKLHNIDFGEVRVDFSEGLMALENYKVSDSINERICFIESAQGHLSNGHKKLTILAHENNIRLPYSGFNGDGGGR